MRKTILLLLLIATGSSNAASEWNWVEIGKRINEKGIILNFYADLSTTSIENNKRKVWTLFEFSKQQGSIKQQEEYDCNQKTIKHLHRLNYYGNMGTGKFDVMTLTKEEQKFHPILPGHLSYTLLNIVCNVAAEPKPTIWSKMVVNSDRSFYIDQATIRKNGQFVQVWSLSSANKIDSRVPSIKILKEFDCKGEKSRILSIISYSERMGLGESDSSHTADPNWALISFNTPDKLTQSLVCREWVLVINTDDTKFYAEPATFRENGQFLILWILGDFKQRDHENYYGALSVITQVEYDCKREKKRILLEIAHS